MYAVLYWEKLDKELSFVSLKTVIERFIEHWMLMSSFFIFVQFNDTYHLQWHYIVALFKLSATNFFIAAFTTCQARLKLYESLEILKDRVLYYDTDSAVYKWKPGESEIALGDYLGDMTNELEEGDYIVEFISAGAKNYGYVTAKGKSCVKVKGFPLNVRGMAQLN